MKTDITELPLKSLSAFMQAAGIYRGFIDLTEENAVVLHWQAKGA